MRSMSLAVYHLLLSLPNGLSSTDVFNHLAMEGLPVSEASVADTLAELLESGLIVDTGGTYFPVSTADDPSLADPSVDPSVTDALNNLFALVDNDGSAESLDSFLAAIRTDGLDSSDANLGIYIASELSRRMLTKVRDARLRIGLTKTVRLLEMIKNKLDANP